MQNHWRRWQKMEACDTNATTATILRVANALHVTPATLFEQPPDAEGSPST